MARTRRAISLLLIWCMALGLLPNMAFAAADTGSFTDVKETDWFYEDVAYVCEHDMMNGTSATEFSPELTTTRAMIVTILHRLEGTPQVSTASFSDVPEGTYYTEAVAWAAENGIVNGYNNGLFGPNDNITREQMAAILYRYSNYKGYDMAVSGDISTFTDAVSINSYAAEAMQWANAKGLITGVTATTLEPQGNATRAQVAAILNRFCKNIVPAGQQNKPSDEVKSYTVTFNLNYGSNDTYQTATVNKGNTTKKPSDPTRTGYTFNGWYKEKTGGAAFDFAEKITADITLYTHWTIKSSGGGSGGSGGGKETYAVTFEFNDGRAVESKEIKSGDKVSKPTDPTKDGYKFIGWYTDNNTFEKIYDFNSAVTGNLTLYANWQKNTGDIGDETKYTVTFDSNDGSTVASQEIKSGDKVSKPTDPTKDGYKFIGWYTDNNTFKNAYDFNTAVTGELTLYAKWEKNTGDETKYTVTFNSNDGSAVESQEIKSGDKISKPTDPTKDGYKFIGWYTDNNTFKNAYDFNTAVTGELTLYAKWEKNTSGSDTEKCKVTFNFNNGSKNESIEVAKGSTLSARETTPEKEGHIFAGWYTTSSFDEQFLFDHDTVNGNITLYANWIQADEDSMMVDYAARQVIIGYQPGDNADSVTKDVILPTTIEDADEVTISWSSDNTAIVSNEGKVTRPDVDNADITVTATVQRNGTSLSIPFQLCVMHKHTRDTSGIENITLYDISKMNTENAYVTYSDDKKHIKTIRGKYSEIKVDNIDDALDVIQGVHTLVGIENPYNELEPVVTNTDVYGSSYTFNQKYNGYPVYGRNITVSVDENGSTYFLSSGIYSSADLDSVIKAPTVSKEDAEKSAVNYYGGDCTVATEETELIIYSVYKYISTPVLAYKMYIDGTDKSGKYVCDIVFVNAATGEIVDAVSKLACNSIEGQGKNELGLMVKFPVDAHKWPFESYRMEDKDLKIRIGKYENASRVTPVIKQGTNIWNDSQAVSAYTNMRNIINWWKTEFNRKSLDDKNMRVWVITHDTSKYNNAFWNSNGRMHICDITDPDLKYSYAAAPDVLVHETTHAVMQYSVGECMAGAKGILGDIGEGYGDVFGCFYDKDWRHGQNVYSDPSNCDRDPSDPGSTKAFNRGPDRISSSLHLDPNSPEDNGYVHQNSLLISHAAYLMTNPDKILDANSNGLPMDTLKKLWCESIKQGYDATSDYTNVRENMLAAATSLQLSDDDIKIIILAFDEEEIFSRALPIIAGQVVNEQTGLPLEGVYVKLYCKNVIDDTESLEDTVTTIANGTFQFTPIGDKVPSYALFEKDGFISVRAKISDQSLNMGTIKLSPGNMVTGIVQEVTAEGENKPLEGAIFKFIRSNGNSLTFAGKDYTKTSGKDGKFTFTIPDDTYTLEISKSGYKTESVNVTVAPDGDKNLSINLSKLNMVDNSVTGVVKYSYNGEKHPLTGATVQVREGSNNESGEVKETAKTGTDGRFSFDLPAGEYTLTPVSSSCNSKSISFTVTDGQPTDLGEIILEPSPFHGTVYNMGWYFDKWTGLSNVTVTLTSADGTTNTVTTGSGGKFTIPVLPGQSYKVSFEHNKYGKTGKTKTIDLPADHWFSDEYTVAFQTATSSGFNRPVLSTLNQMKAPGYVHCRVTVRYKGEEYTSHSVEKQEM